MTQRKTISDAPKCLNTNDKAMWVTGWNECVEARAPQPVQPAANQKLLQIIAAAYQIAGVYDAPGYVLDVLANPAAATQDDIDALLPFVTAQPSPARELIDKAIQDAIYALEWHYGRGYPEQPTDEPRKRDARALQRLKAAINDKG